MKNAGFPKSCFNGFGFRKSIQKSSDPTKELAKLASFLVIGDKADGTSAGKNSPFTNHWTDLSGDADITLQGFNATSASGWKQETNEGKTFVGLQSDGANDVGIMGSNAPNPIGMQDFGFSFVFKTNQIITDSWFFIKSGASSVGCQYGFFVSSTGKKIFVDLEGSTKISSQNNSLVENTFYKMVLKRKSGQLSLKLNELSTNAADNTALTSKPNANIFARPNNIGNTSWAAYNNFILFLASYNNGTNIDKWEQTVNKVCKQRYNL